MDKVDANTAIAEVDVPNENVTDENALAFDHTSLEWRDDQEAQLQYFHKHCPFGRGNNHGGFWYVLGADLARDLFNRPEEFVSSQGIVIPEPPFAPTMIPINIDPPDLLTWRQILNGPFAPKRMNAMEPRLRQEAFDLFDAALASGEVDMVNDVAQPLTGKFTLEIIGLDPDDWMAFALPFHQYMFSLVSPEEERGSARAMEEKLHEDIRALVGTPQATGMIKYLSEEAKFNGRDLTHEEIVNICLILLGGGLDNTQGVIGMATVYLGEHLDRQQELIDHPERLDGAIEELLRAFPPAQNLMRAASHDTVINDCPIKTNDRLLMSLVGANHDPAEFPDPFTIDFEREANRHFSFGMGPHRCLGSHLARLEIKVCLEALLDRAPGFRVPPDQHEHLTQNAGIFHAYEQVKLILP